MLSEGLRWVAKDSHRSQTAEDCKFSISRGRHSTNGVQPCEIPHEHGGNETYGTHSRLSSGAEATVSDSIPAYHASGQGPWCAVISYEACVRLCLHSRAKGCREASFFLNDELTCLRDAFGLQHILLPPEEELLNRRSSSEVVYDKVTPRPRRAAGKMKVRVRRIKMDVEPSTCSLVSLKTLKKKMQCSLYDPPDADLTLSPSKKKNRSVESYITNMKLTPTSWLEAIRRACKSGSFDPVKEFCVKLKVSLVNEAGGPASFKLVSELYSCVLRLKSSMEEGVKMQPGSGESHVFLPNNSGDDLILEVLDSSGKCVGRVLAQVAVIAEDPGDRLRWWPIFREPEHEIVGRIQLQINYTSSFDENNHVKCGCVAETVSYDVALEVAMKVQNFRQRNLLLHGPWKWLLVEFASYYGVSDPYTKLRFNDKMISHYGGVRVILSSRYLSHVMDVATPTADCLLVVYKLLASVLSIEDSKNTLSHQENRMLGEAVIQVQEIIAVVFENYKSLDETAQSGLMGDPHPATGTPPPALVPAVKLFDLLHDSSSASRLKLCRYFQAAARKRSRAHLTETDVLITENKPVNPAFLSTAYAMMKSLCSSMHNEILTDIEIRNHNILPSFVDLPNLLSSIYSGDLMARLRAFMSAHTPTRPSVHMVELIVQTANFQSDLTSWSIGHVRGGVDASELFQSHVDTWIQLRRRHLLDKCRLDTVKRAGRHSTTPFVDDMYDELMEVLDEYDGIVRLWPENASPLEAAVADVERAVMDALDKQYADILMPLKEGMKILLGMKYVQKIAKGTPAPYAVPDELGIFMNSVKRMLDVLHPKLEYRYASWRSIPGNHLLEDHPGEVTVMLRTKFRVYQQAIIDKLAENTRMQSGTKLKAIMKELKDCVGEADVRSKMHSLEIVLGSMMGSIHAVFENAIFASICRGVWDRLGQDVLGFLESRRESTLWYRGSRIAVEVLNGIFVAEMERLVGTGDEATWQEVEVPGSIKEVQSVLCGDR